MEHSSNGKTKINSLHTFTQSGKKKSSKLSIDDQIIALKSLYAKIDSNKIQSFQDFPLSNRTQKGLKASKKYIVPTDIQRECIGLALQGNDIVGEAKTGSGKTLAFVIPLLECLYREKWTKESGLGALIISPTKELACQTFHVVNSVGCFHDFSLALVSGGLSFKGEKKCIAATNIVVCTPGRLLEHLDKTSGFDASALHVLVLDEADRILDLGFKKTMDAIFQNLPAVEWRQTLLFSATLTDDVKILAQRCLNAQPMLVSHMNDDNSTPEALRQIYVVCELPEKVNLLWSFIRCNLKQKTMVFMSTCKQVRFVYESFRRLRPGLTLLMLHGAMNKTRRQVVFDEFCRKKHAVLFTTDVAGRGLDPPEVTWVLQLDCPEDVKAYIHRVGRTARNKTSGQAMLVLMPSELAILDELKARVPIEEKEARKSKMEDVQQRLESLCAVNVELKEAAQRAFRYYIISVLKQKKKRVFDILKLDTDNFARSLGLAFPPKLKLLQKKKKKNDTNIALREDEKIYNSDGDCKKEEKSGKQFENCSDDTNSDDEEETLLKAKRRVSNYNGNISSDATSSDDDIPEMSRDTKAFKLSTKASNAKKTLRKMTTINTKIVFPDDDDSFAQIGEAMEEKSWRGYSIEEARERLQEADNEDKEHFKRRIKESHVQKKLKEKKRKMQQVVDDDGEMQAVLRTEDGSEEEDVNRRGSEIDETQTDDDASGHDDSEKGDDMQMKGYEKEFANDDNADRKNNKERNVATFVSGGKSADEMSSIKRRKIAQQNDRNVDILSLDQIEALSLNFLRN